MTAPAGSSRTPPPHVLTRNVASASGDLAATTSKTGDTVLHLTTIHGDVALQLPLDTSKAPVALDSDEYGNPRAGQAATRYNWLGAKQRSTETLTGLTLMGARLYNPNTGRFLSIDPVYGGGDNRYGYPGDPVNQFDLDGKSWWSKVKRAAKKVGRVAWKYKWDIALTAAGFIPGVGAVAWGVRAYRAYRVVRAARTARHAARAYRGARHAARGNSYRRAAGCAIGWGGGGAMFGLWHKPSNSNYQRGLSVFSAADRRGALRSARPVRT